MEMVKIYNAENGMVANQIKSLLQDEGIQATTMEVGSGQLFNIGANATPFGVDILVNEDSADKAKALVETIFINDSDSPGEEENDNSDSKPKFRDSKFGLRIFIIFVLILFLATLGICYFGNIFHLFNS